MAGDPSLKGRFLAGMVSFVIGLGLLGLAIPRTIVAFVALPARPMIVALGDERILDNSDISGAVTALSNAMSWSDAARLRTDIALLLIGSANQAVADMPLRHQRLREAEGMLRQGLAGNPANGFAWVRLALVCEALDGPSRTVAAATVMAVRTSPGERRLRVAALGLAMRNHAYLSQLESATIDHYLASAWRDETYRRAWMRGVRAHSAEAMIWNAMADDPGGTAEFKAMLEEER
ncbi:MAG: hypothetical protein WCK65_11475 [Rhodospirillaceae bacterium]